MVQLTAQEQRIARMVMDGLSKSRSAGACWGPTRPVIRLTVSLLTNAP